MTKAVRSKLLYPLIILAGFSAWGMLTTIFNYGNARLQDKDPNLGVWILGGQFIWLFWAASIPLVLILVRKLRLTRDTWLKTISFHAAAAFVFAGFHMIYLFYIYPVPEWIFSTGNYFDRWTRLPGVSDLMSFRLPVGMIYYLAIAGIAYAYDFYRESHNKEIKAANLESELKQSQLLLLKMQLQPHFLYNALQSVVSLIRDNRNSQAISATVSLASLLRYSLDEISSNEVLLEEEFSYISRYVELERLRFGDSLSVTMEPSKESLKAYVPNLILQPIVENAIKHGTTRSTESACITVSTDVIDDELVICVRNSGPRDKEQPSENQPDRLGHSITRQRLTHMYGEDYQLSIGPADEAGFEVRIVIPYTTVPLWS